MIAEPLPSCRVRFISIHADHDVTVPEDLYDGGHADGGKVERIHGFQLLPCFESPGGCLYSGNMSGVESVSRYVSIRHLVIQAYRV